MRRIPRSDHSAGLLSGAFLQIVDNPNVDSMLDVAAGDSSLAYMLEQEYGKTVVRVDTNYSEDHPTGTGWVPGNATELPFPDGSFGGVTCSFLMQHLQKDKQADAVGEMIRVADKDLCEEFHIGIFPVYKGRKLEQALKERAVTGDAASVVKFPWSTRDYIAWRLAYPTLYINAGKILELGLSEELTEAIVATGALRRMKTFRDVRCSVRMAISGSNRVHSPA